MKGANCIPSVKVRCNIQLHWEWLAGSGLMIWTWVQCIWGPCVGMDGVITPIGENYRVVNRRGWLRFYVLGG